MYVRMYVYVYVYIGVYVCVYLFIYYLFTHHMCTYMYTHTCIYIYTYTHTHIYIYICAYLQMYIYIQNAPACITPKKKIKNIPNGIEISQLYPSYSTSHKLNCIPAIDCQHPPASSHRARTSSIACPRDDTPTALAQQQLGGASHLASGLKHPAWFKPPNWSQPRNIWFPYILKDSPFGSLTKKWRSTMFNTIQTT